MKPFIKEFMNSVAVSVTGAVVTIALLLLVFYMAKPIALERYVQEVGYNIAIDRASNNDYVYMVYKLCELKKDDAGKVYCVYNFFQNIMDYEYQEQINPIEFTLINESDCENAMVFYCAVFKRLNISCQPTLIDGHVWATVQFDGGYCNIDQQRIDCN